MTETAVFSLPNTAEKPQYVQNLFHRVASYYDIMNDVMSMGLHRLWKKQACQKLSLKSGDTALDVCCGTGDLEGYLHQMQPDVAIMGLDFCPDMLAIGEKRFQHQTAPVQFVQGDAMALPFPDNSFNGVVISYGLRNVANYEQCLQEMIRVTKPGGKVVILDMSHPTPLMNALSSFYRFTVMPLMGKLVANDPDAYRYLSNSIYFYLNQQQLADLMTQTGLQQVQYQNKMGGICALHWGTKAF